MDVCAELMLCVSLYSCGPPLETDLDVNIHRSNHHQMENYICVRRRECIWYSITFVVNKYNIIPKYRFVASLRLKSNFQLTKESGEQRAYTISIWTCVYLYTYVGIYICTYINTEYTQFGIIKQITKKQGEFQSKSVTYVCNIHIPMCCMGDISMYVYIYTIQPNIYPVALTLVCLTSSYICATQTVGVRREIGWFSV